MAKKLPLVERERATKAIETLRAWLDAPEETQADYDQIVDDVAELLDQGEEPDTQGTPSATPSDEAPATRRRQLREAVRQGPDGHRSDLTGGSMAERGNAAFDGYTERIATAGQVARTLNELHLAGYTQHEIIPLPTVQGPQPWNGLLRFLVIGYNPHAQLLFDSNKETRHA